MSYKFEVGDRVKCVNDYDLLELREGDIVTIEQNLDNAALSFEGIDGYYSTSRFVLFQKATKPDAETVFQVGDIVQFVGSGHSSMRYGELFVVESASIDMVSIEDKGFYLNRNFRLAEQHKDDVNKLRTLYEEFVAQAQHMKISTQSAIRICGGKNDN